MVVLGWETDPMVYAELKFQDGGHLSKVSLYMNYRVYTACHQHQILLAYPLNTGGSDVIFVQCNGLRRGG
jgi:hypothetical protein